MRRIRVLVLVPLFSPFLFVLTDTTSNGKKQSPRKSGQIYEQDLSLSLSVLQICTLFSPHGIVSFVRSLVPFRSGEREVIQTASGLDREIKTRRKRGVGSSSLLFLLLMLVLLLIGAGGSDLFCIRILSVRFCFFEENFFAPRRGGGRLIMMFMSFLIHFTIKERYFLSPWKGGGV